MLGKHVIIRFSSINYMFSVNYIFLVKIKYVFAIMTCFGFLALFHIRPKKFYHKFLGHRLIAFSYAAFVILFSELKKQHDHSTASLDL